jgi:hypothetical protein
MSNLYLCRTWPEVADGNLYLDARDLQSPGVFVSGKLHRIFF